MRRQGSYYFLLLVLKLTLCINGKNILSSTDDNPIEDNFKSTKVNNETETLFSTGWRGFSRNASESVESFDVLDTDDRSKNGTENFEPVFKKPLFEDKSNATLEADESSRKSDENKNFPSVESKESFKESKDENGLNNIKVITNDVNRVQNKFINSNNGESTRWSPRDARDFEPEDYDPYDERSLMRKSSIFDGNSHMREAPPIKRDLVNKEQFQNGWKGLMTVPGAKPRRPQNLQESVVSETVRVSDQVDNDKDKVDDNNTTTNPEPVSKEETKLETRNITPSTESLLRLSKKVLRSYFEKENKAREKSGKNRTTSASPKGVQKHDLYYDYDEVEGGESESPNYMLMNSQYDNQGRPVFYSNSRPNQQEREMARPYPHITYTQQPAYTQYQNQFSTAPVYHDTQPQPRPHQTAESTEQEQMQNIRLFVVHPNDMANQGNNDGKNSMTFKVELPQSDGQGPKVFMQDNADQNQQVKEQHVSEEQNYNQDDLSTNESKRVVILLVINPPNENRRSSKKI